MMIKAYELRLSSEGRIEQAISGLRTLVLGLEEKAQLNTL
jgi:hypothetical protein